MFELTVAAFRGDKKPAVFPQSAQHLSNFHAERVTYSFEEAKSQEPHNDQLR